MNTDTLERLPTYSLLAVRYSLPSRSDAHE
jgi:hypothetical protein